MNYSALVQWSTVGLIVARWAAQFHLERLNRRHVLVGNGAVAKSLESVMDPVTRAKSVQYTLAKSRLHQRESMLSAILLLTLLYSGVLPWAEGIFTVRFGTTAWVAAAFLFVVGLALALTSLPLDWHAQFHVEEQFGFNTTTKKLWWIDRLKAFFLALLLGYPVLWLILKIVEWSGDMWWWRAWLALIGIELMMIVIAPRIILPLFNRLTPLPDGALRERLTRLGARTDFAANDVQVIDGSKRSLHSNAFFTGFGRFRRIILFDTLVHQLTEPELEAVLAHEIGHWKKKHVAKMLFWSAITSLAGLYVLSWLAGRHWFLPAFGFAAGNTSAAFLLFALLGGTVTFWILPLRNLWSRHYEYQADGYAAEIVGESQPLVGALRKLYEKNLSNLTPHPLYARFYHSHPGLREREEALTRKFHTSHESTTPCSGVS